MVQCSFLFLFSSCLAKCRLTMLYHCHHPSSSFPTDSSYSIALILLPAAGGSNTDYWQLMGVFYNITNCQGSETLLCECVDAPASLRLILSCSASSLNPPDLAWLGFNNLLLICLSRLPNIFIMELGSSHIHIPVIPSGSISKLIASDNF